MHSTAKRFWLGQASYPKYDHVELRRFHDISYIVPRMAAAESVVDIGCGDGSTSLALSCVTPAKRWHLIDQAPQFLATAQKRWPHGDAKQLEVTCRDVTAEAAFPAADLALCLGVFCYVRSDSELISTLSRIDSPRMIVRVPCAMGSKTLHIDKYSAALGADYEAIYRTPLAMLSILTMCWDVQEMTRIWPDEVESKHGTKQFVFDCIRRGAVTRD